jgi:hypothetical protein
MAWKVRTRADERMRLIGEHLKGERDDDVMPGVRRQSKDRVQVGRAVQDRRACGAR